MYKKSFDNIFGNPFENMLFIVPRELLHFEKGEGTLQRCIDRFIQIIVQQEGKDQRKLKVYCSRIEPEEEKLFNEVLFDMLFDSEYTTKKGLYLMLEEFVKLTDMTAEKVTKILTGLTMINIGISDGGNTVNLFTGVETGPCYNTKTGEYDGEEFYCALDINEGFLKACLEVKVEMDGQETY